MSDVRRPGSESAAPDEQVLAAWGRLSMLSRPAVIVRRDAVALRGRSRRWSSVGGTISLAVVVAVVAIGVLGLGRVAMPGASPSPAGSASVVAIEPTGSAALVPSSSSPSAIPTAAVASPPSGGFARVSDGLFLNPNDGWALTADALHLTHDGGASWIIATPTGVGAERIVGAAFADVLHGWVVSETYLAQGGSGELVVHLHRTDDGGSTWETVELARVPSPGPDPTVGFPTFSILSPSSMFIMLALPDAPGFVSRLYKTADGGRSWDRRAGVTEGGRFAFIDERRGWAIRGDTGSLARTADGGRSWKKVELPRSTGSDGLALYPSIPVATTDGLLVLVLSSGRDGAPALVYTTRDIALLWTFVGEMPPAAFGSIAILDDGTWYAGGSPPQRSIDGGRTWMSDDGAPDGVMSSVRIGAGGAVSAVRTDPTGCGPLTDCFVPSRLWVSNDNGVTWRDVTP